MNACTVIKQIFKQLRNVSLWQTLQTIVLVSLLLDILVPFPSRFTTYAIGFGFIIAMVHWGLLPQKEKWNLAWKYALPYLVFYVLMLFSGLFSGNFFLFLQKLWQYTPLLLIPLIFVGMTPAFFNRKRIRIFAFALIFGVLAGYLWKVGVFIFEYARPESIKELGWSDAFREFYRLAMGPQRKWTLHPAFEALFGNLAIAIILIAWIKKDAFFYHGYKKAFAFVYIFLISINIFLFCTKTSALCCIMIFFSIWIYALCRKNYRFFGVLSAIGLLFVCGAFLLFAKQESTLGERYKRTENAIRSFAREGGKINNEKDGSFTPRLYCYQQTWDMFQEKPIIGWGPAYGREFQTRFQKNYDIGYPQEGLKYPHNEFLEVMLFGGVLGLLVFIWLLLSALHDVRCGKKFYGWIWLVYLLVFFMVESIFDRTVGFVFLCGVHGVLFCQSLMSKTENLPTDKSLNKDSI